MRIFAGEMEASNDSEVVENGDFRLFRSLSSEASHLRPHLLYCAM